MNAISELEKWYASQCNEDWEHTYGIEIGTIDNPGWSLKIDLQDTYLYEKHYGGFSYGTGTAADTSGDDWILTKVESGKFIAYGGPAKLEEMLSVFLKWAHVNA